MISTRNSSTPLHSPLRAVRQLEIELDSIDLVGRKIGQEWPEESQTSFLEWDKISCADTCAETETYASSHFDLSFTSRPDVDCEDENRKRVSFKVDEQDNIVATEFPAPQIILTHQEVNSLWWKPLEFKYFKRYSKKISQAAQNSTYLKDFKSFYEMCESLSIKKKDIRFFARICNTPARGLEVPIFDPIMADRKLTIEGVLKAQSKVVNGLDRAQKVKVLAATSKYLSKHARAMAYALGQGDAAIARGIRREFEQETEKIDKEGKFEI